MSKFRNLVFCHWWIVHRTSHRLHICRYHVHACHSQPTDQSIFDRRTRDSFQIHWSYYLAISPNTVTHQHKCIFLCLLFSTCCTLLHTWLLLPSFLLPLHAIDRLSMYPGSVLPASLCRPQIHLPCCYSINRHRCPRQNGKTFLSRKHD